MKKSMFGQNNPMFGRYHSEEAKKKMSEAAKGRIISEETRRKISEAKKGKCFSEVHKQKISISLIGKNLGKRRSEEVKKKLSESHKGHVVSEETRRKMSEALKGKTYEEIYGIEEAANKRKHLSEINKGKTLSKETIEKIGLIHRGHSHGPMSEEQRLKISQSCRDRVPWNKGIPRIEETKQKISKANKGKIKGIIRSEETRKKISESHKGDKCNWWKGGIYKNPYSINFTRELKQYIRKRDNYTCKICNRVGTIIVHHIDYNKENSSTDNLITLCRNCHSRTNCNREYWISYFAKKEVLQCCMPDSTMEKKAVSQY